MTMKHFIPATGRRTDKPRNGFWRDKRGMAATEFALLLPIMTFFFFGILEVSDAMIANRRVVNATNSLADLVTQEKKVSGAHVSDIFSGVASMLEPTNSSTVTMRLVSVTLDVGDEDDPDDDRIVVEWSRQDNGSVPYAAGSEFTKIEDSTIVKANTSLVIAEVVYQYHSGLSDRVLGSPITFTRMASRWPRRSSRVQFCNDSYTSCS
jgi:Flp pilus assembly protein TadG